jgi:hypothetical protein
MAGRERECRSGTEAASLWMARPRTDKDRASETREAAPQFVASLIEATRKSNALKSGPRRDCLVKRCHLIADFRQQLYVGGEVDRFRDIRFCFFLARQSVHRSDDQK